METTLTHVAVGCHAATNALSVDANASSTSSAYVGAFAAKNVVALLSCGSEADVAAPPLKVVETLKHREPTTDRSRLTSVKLLTEAKSDTVRVLAGDSDGRVFLWTKQSGRWKAQKLLELPDVAVAAVVATQTNKRRMHLASFSDGTLVAFAQSLDSEEVKLLTKLELGVKCIMEALDAIVIQGSAGDESVLVAAGGVDAEVHLFEVAEEGEDLTPLIQLEGHRGWIRSVAFRTDDHIVMLASASQDQRIRLWKITTRSKDSGAPMNGSSVDAQGGFLAVGQKLTYTISFDALLAGHEDWVTSVQWMELPRGENEGPKTSQNACVLSSSMDNTLIAWTKPTDVRSSWSPTLRIGELGGNGLLAGGVLPSRNGRLNLLSLGFGGQLERWEQQPAPSALFLPAIAVNGHCAEVTDLSWSPRGDYLMSVSLDQTARVLAPAKESDSIISGWYELSRAQVHGYDINCGCFVLGDVATNNQFVSGADEKILRVFEAPQEVKTLVNQLKYGHRSEHETAMKAEEDAKTGTRGVHHAYLPELSLTNKSSSETIEDSSNGSAELFNAVRLPVGDTLSRKTLWPEQRKLYGHGNELLSVASSHAGDLIASACKSREERFAAVRLWNTADWSETQQPLEGHKSSVVQLAFSPNDQFLLSVSRDRQFCLYERQSQSDGEFELAERVKAHRRIIWSCSWAPDSSTFALGSRDQTMSFWSQTRGKWSRSCEPIAFNAAVTAVAFSPYTGATSDAPYLLAVGLESGAIQVFTITKVVQDGRPTTVACTLLQEIEWELSASSAILRLAWGPIDHDGNYLLAAASSDNSVRVFKLAFE